MNDSVYEEYMRSVLGYSPMNYQNTYDRNSENFAMTNMNVMNNMPNEELEECYPDIYRIVYPMIQKACMQNSRPMTRELVDSMTEEIYFAIEDNEITETRGKDEKSVKQTDTKVENRQRIVRNTGLNDLIRILILRELLGRPGGRPPYQRPPRLPMRPPVGPGPRPPRPGMGPFNRQSYSGFDDNLFEY